MKKITIVLLLILTIQSGLSQSNYNFEVENIPYQDLTNSTSLNNGLIWDDPGYTIPIGFTFTLGTHSFNTIYIVDWGLGGALSSSPTDVGNVPALALLTQDLVSFESGGSSTSPISYQLDGSAGNRILKIEWKNFGFFEDSTGNDFMNMQLWLYEETNVIEYRYGPNAINNPADTFEGLTGFQVELITSFNFDTAMVTDNAYLLSGNPASPTLVTYLAGENIDFELALNGAIPNGTVYRFLPENLSVTAINKPIINIYPNPATNFVYLQSPNAITGVTIYNALGSIVRECNESFNKLDVSNLVPGVYIMEVSTDKGKSVLKFVKR